MDVKKILEATWNFTLSSLGPLILLTLAYAIVIVFSFGILAPVATAGYTRSLLDLQREGRSPNVKDLFSEMSLFLPLTIFFIVAAIAAFIGFIFLILPGFMVIAFLVFAAFYVLPLMVGERLGIMEALKASWEMATEEPLIDHVIVVVLYLIITSVGGSIPFGFLITQPFATLLMLEAYSQRRSAGADQGEQPPPPPPG